MATLFVEQLRDAASALFSQLVELPLADRVEAINAIRSELHKHSPFASEPVDCVLWVPNESVQANDYNPNTVAPPEMRLLERSIMEDGYTQPIVAWLDEGHYGVVDGYHRNRVGRECTSVRERVHGYLPLSVVNASRTDRGDRIAATIRHNRARGKHRIDSMSDIVVELKRRNWSDSKIGKELGMDPDEVLRLTQITGLAEMFADREFSQAWEAESSTEIDETDNLSIVEERPVEENPSALQDVGGLAGRDVPGTPVEPAPKRNRRSRKVVAISGAAAGRDAAGDVAVAGIVPSEPEQPEPEPSCVAGSGGVLFAAGSAGLPHETRMAQSHSKPARSGKRRSRNSD